MVRFSRALFGRLSAWHRASSLGAGEGGGGQMECALERVGCCDRDSSMHRARGTDKREGPDCAPVPRS